MNAAERLNALLYHMHTNAKSLSELCGYDRPQAFYDVQKGKTRNISSTMCDRILSVFPNISRVWLLTGEGEMCASSHSVPAEAQPDREEVYKVPLVHVTALAGPLCSYYQDGEKLVDCELIQSPSRQAEIAVPVSGDSMEPLFPDGSTVFVRRINEAAFIPWGQAMVIETENGVFIKNVLPDPDNSNYILAESENPRYPAMRIPKPSIYSMYRVLAVTKTFHAC